MTDTLTLTEEAFLIALGAFRDAHADTPPVSWPNKHYDPDPDTLYLEALFLVNKTERAGLTQNSMTRERGMFQVNVRAPQGKGPVAASLMAGDVRAYFLPAQRTTLINGSVTVRLGPQLAYRGGAFGENNRNVIPVTIPWWVDQAPA